MGLLKANLWPNWDQVATLTELEMAEIAAATKILNSRGHEWSKAKDASKQLKLDLDLIKLASTEFDLFDFIVTNDLEDVKGLFQAAMKRELGEVGLVKDDEDVVIDLRVTNLVPKIRDEIASFSGILMAISEKKNYMKNYRLICSKVNCEAVLGECAVKVKVTFDRDEDDSNQPCPMCMAPMTEDPKYTQISTYVVAKFNKARSFINQSDLNQSLDVFIKDDELTSKLVLGQKYRIVGKFAAKHTFEAIFLDFSPRLTQRLDANLIPGRFLDGFDGGNPWFLVQTLTLSLGQHLAPKMSHVNLKMCLLLSLTSTLSGGIHLLLHGSDNLLAERLMRNGLQMSDRVAIFDPQQDVTLKSAGNKSKIGCLDKAKEGVCFLGDLTHKVKKAILEDLKSETEKGVQCSIWAKSEATKGQGQQLAAFFDLTYSIECDEDLNEEEIYHVLAQQPQNRDDLTEWIKLAVMTSREAEVEMEPDSLQLLKRYFVAVRRVQKTLNPDSFLPQSTLKILISMCEAHAKLSRHSTVSLADTLASLRLFHELLSVRLKGSFLDMEFKSKRKEESYVEEYAREMSEFFLKLMEFLQNYSVDISFEE